MAVKSQQLEPTILSLDQWEKVRENTPEGTKPLWVPNPCYKCSDLYKKEADGIDPETGKTCDACGGSKYGPQYKAYLADEDEILLGGARGGAKAQSLDSKVLTPFGWKRMGNIHVGDSVVDPTTGGSSTVLAVHPQGEKVLYRITCDDGATTLCCADHLWSFRLSNRKRPGTKKSSQREYAASVLGSEVIQTRWTTLRTDNTLAVKQYLDEGLGVRIPLAEPTLYTVNDRSYAGSADPYIVGLYLGDGNHKGLSITCFDGQNAKFLQEHGFELRHAGHYYPNKEIRKTYDTWMRNHNLRECRSWEKFIPSYIQTTNLEYKLSVLQGLMDSDGTVDERGRCYFTSTSFQLAKDVQELVRSIGGKCRLKKAKAGYKNKDGDYVLCKAAYKLRIWLRKTSALFRLNRKKERCTDSWNGGHELTREIVSIEEVGAMPAQCITVSSPHGLYVTDDFIVTHNSNLAIIFLLKGNPHLPQTDKVNQSYLFSPHYRALILRRNSKDLAAFISEASTYFKYFGGEFKYGEGCFRFPSGAVIWTGHLDSDEAYEKYLGMPELHRLVIEELTLIPNEELFMKVLTSVRSTKEGLNTQILATTNPIGPGLSWVKSRYVKGFHKDGTPWKPEDRITFEYKNPYTDDIMTRTRKFIPALVRDNPFLMKDTNYIATLMQLPEKQRMALLHGSWDVLEGAYFSIYRDPDQMELPLAGEPDNACHVISKKHGGIYPDIQPWWPRAIGGDWGFSHETAYYWGTVDPDTQRRYVYDEYVVSNMSAEQVGIEIAKRSIETLNEIPGHKLTMYFSPDAFQKRSDDFGMASFAQLVGYGMSQILGGGNIGIPDLAPMTAHEIYTNKFRDKWGEYAQELHLRKQTGIEIKRAINNRVFGWHYILSMMRWEEDDLYTGEYNQKTYDDLFKQFGKQAADSYKESFMKMTVVRPQLQIYDKCERLRQAIPNAMHDEKNQEDLSKVHFRGMDSLDAFRYLITGLQDTQVDPGMEVKTQKYMREFTDMNPNADINDLIAARAHFTYENDPTHGQVYGKIGSRASARRNKWVN